MAEHENSIGGSDEWYTPPEIFDALGCEFDLDPCSPGPDHWVPCRRAYTVDDDGLSQDWEGFVFMNPPFGGRNGHIPWLNKFFQHGNGIAIVRAYTSSGWFHDHAIHADAMLFPKGKTKFIRPDGSIGKAPGHGVVLLGVGGLALAALRDAAPELGWLVETRLMAAATEVCELLSDAIEDETEFETEWNKAARYALAKVNLLEQQE